MHWIVGYAQARLQVAATNTAMDIEVKYAETLNAKTIESNSRSQIISLYELTFDDLGKFASNFDKFVKIKMVLLWILEVKLLKFQTEWHQEWLK